MNTAFIIAGLLIIGFILLNIIARKQMRKTPAVPDHANILTLTDKNFQTQTKNKLVLVDFWASWCAPCRMMAPVLNDAANELDGRTRIGKVNIEQYQSLAQQYKVRSIPTMILFQNGIEINRFSGVKSKEYLMQQIHKAQSLH
jgi:thioredoxin 1